MAVTGIFYKLVVTSLHNYQRIRAIILNQAVLLGIPTNKRSQFLNRFK